MDRVRRIFSISRADKNGNTNATSNNNGSTIDNLAKSASNTFGIPGRTTFNAASKIESDA